VAEGIRDWNAAISLVSARAECYSTDFHAHDNHLWHMDLLVRAERFEQLTELALTDVHARRRLNRPERFTNRESTRPCAAALRLATAVPCITS